MKPTTPISRCYPCMPSNYLRLRSAGSRWGQRVPYADRESGATRAFMRCLFLFPGGRRRVFTGAQRPSLYGGRHPVGIIHEANYEDVCDCILQRNHVDSAQPNRKQFRNDKAREIYEKLQRAKKNHRSRRRRSRRMRACPTSFPRCAFNITASICAMYGI